jgi:hypothetical protein
LDKLNEFLKNIQLGYFKIFYIIFNLWRKKIKKLFLFKYY